MPDIDSLATKHPWMKRAMTDTLNIPREKGPSSSVSTFTFSDDKGHYVAPTIRKVDGALKEYGYDEAERLAVENQDAVRFNTLEEAEAFSKEFSNYLGSRSKKQTEKPMTKDIQPLEESEDFGFTAVPDGTRVELAPEDDFGFAPQDPDDIKLSPNGERLKEAADRGADDLSPWEKIFGASGEPTKEFSTMGVAGGLINPVSPNVAEASQAKLEETYVFRAGFNGSLMGLAYDISNGEAMYDQDELDKMDPNFLQDVAAISLGFLFDGPLFAAGGMMGKGAASLVTRTALGRGIAYSGFNLVRKGLTKLGVKGILAEDMIAAAATKNSKILLNLAAKAPPVLEGMGGSAGALGLYNSVGEVLGQMKEEDIPMREVEWRDVRKQGVIGMKLGVALAATGIGGKYLESVMAKGLGKFGQVSGKGIAFGAEIGVFGAGDAFLQDKPLSSVDWLHTLKMVLGSKGAGYVQHPGATVKKYSKYFEKSKAFEDPARKKEFDAELTPLEKDMVEGYRPEGEIGPFSQKLNDKTFVEIMADENIPWITKSKLLYERTGTYAKIAPEINGVEIFKSEEGYGIKAYQVDKDGSKMLVDAVRASTKGEAEKNARFLDREAVDMGKHREFEKLSLPDKEAVSNGTLDANMDLNKVLDAWETRPEHRSAEQEKLMRKFYNTWNESLNPPEGKERPKPTTVAGAPKPPLEEPAEPAKPAKTAPIKEQLKDPEVQKRLKEIKEGGELKPGEVTDAGFESNILGMDRVSGSLTKTGEGKYKLIDTELSVAEGKTIEFATDHERKALHEKFDKEVAAAKEEMEVRKFSEPSHSGYRIGRRGFGNKEAFIEALENIPEGRVEGIMDSVVFPTKETSFSEVGKAIEKAKGKKVGEISLEDKYASMGDADLAADIQRNERRKWRIDQAEGLEKPVMPADSKTQSELHEKKGRSTFKYEGKKDGKPGFAETADVKTETPFVVGEKGEVIKGKKVTDEQIQAFKDKHAKELQERHDKGEKVGVGTFYEAKTDKSSIDLFNFVKTKAEAVKLGEAYKQEFIYNLETREVTYVAKEREAEFRAKERAAVEEATKPERESLVKAWEDEFKIYEDTPAQKEKKAIAKGRDMNKKEAKEIKGKLEDFLKENRAQFDRLKIPVRTRTLRQINNITTGKVGWNQVEAIKKDLTMMIQDAEFRASRQLAEKHITSIRKEIDPASMTEATGKGLGKKKAKRSYFNPLSGYQRIEKFETLSGIVEEGLNNPEFRGKAHVEIQKINDRAEKRVRDRERGEEVPEDTDVNGYTLDDAVLKEQLDYATIGLKGPSELKFMLDNIKELKKTDRMASEILREEWKKDKDRRRDLMFEHGSRKGEELQIGSEKKKPKTRHPLKMTGDMSFKSVLSTMASRRDLAGDKSIVFNDPLNKEFMPGISKAEEGHARDKAEYIDTKKAMMNDAYELTGYKEKGRKDLGLENRIQKPDVLMIDMPNDKHKELPLSQYEAGHLWLMLQQEGAEATFRKPRAEHGMGWSDITFEQLENFLDPRVKKLAIKLRNNMNTYKDAKVQPVYRRENGVSLGEVENYWPFTREAGEFSRASSDAMDKQSFHTRVTSDHHIQRTKSTDPFVYMDMMQVYDKYMRDQMHYANWAETVRRLDETFKDPKVRAMITQMHGSNYVDVTDWFIERFAGKTLNDTYQPLDGMIRRMSKGILYLNRAVGLKQTISSAMYLLDMDPYHWGTGIAKMLMTPEGYDLKRYLKKQPFVADRGHAPMDADQNFVRKRDSYKYTENLYKRAGQRARINLQRMFNVIPEDKIDQIASSNIKYGDRFPIVNAGGAYVMDKMRKAGTSWSKANKEAERLAKENGTTKETELDKLMQPHIEKWTMMSEATQQSTRMSNISQWRTGHPLNRSIAMFTSGAGQIHRVATQSLDLAYASARQGNAAAFGVHFKNFMLSHVLMGVMYNLAENGLMLDPENKGGTNKLVWAAALGNTRGLAYFGRLVDVIGAIVQKEPWADKQTMSPIVGMMKNIATELVKASEYHKAGEIDKRNDELVKFGKHLAAFTGYPVKQVFDIVEDIKGIASGETDKPVRQGMGLYDPDYDSGVEIHDMFDPDAWEEARKEKAAVEAGKRQGLTGGQVKKFRQENK
ncbi:hypothetical protein LCGC14_0278540 [marine sediment metagenome]|uniref:Large polyvalent protein associated domain-containing protein n=1 Tax=marine sediment metagenome TaxID=412755 RepID=A0A0F9WHW2_9ZZZZ